MFSLLDDLHLLGKRVAFMATGKWATATAVGLAAPFVQNANHLPMIGLTLGVPITAAIATMAHEYREQKILGQFREEIGARFGIAPELVTQDHLRIMAYGDPDHNIPAQPFFQTIIEKNDKNRWIAMGAKIIGAAIAIGFVISGSLAGITSGVTAAAQASGIAMLAANAPMVGAIGFSLAIGAMVMCLDHVINHIGQELFGNHAITAYEKIEHLARQRGRGIGISQDQVMGMIAKTDPHVTQAIQEHYGRDYSLLPQDTRGNIIRHYNDAYRIAEMTTKINNGQIKLNELAFIAAGERSGVPEQSPNTYNATLGKGMRATLSAVQTHVQSIGEDNDLADNVLRGKLPPLAQATSSNVAATAVASASAEMPIAPPMMEPVEPITEPIQASTRFTDRLVSKAHPAAASHVSRLEAKQATIPESPTIH